LNRWNIPDWLEKEVVARDKYCVYCGVLFGSMPGKGSLASWEHIVNDARIITRESIALCCRSCNSSKGTKALVDWLRSEYCQRRGINRESVAEVVKHALENQP
jgi:hypothetical protein